MFEELAWPIVPSVAGTPSFLTTAMVCWIDSATESPSRYTGISRIVMAISTIRLAARASLPSLTRSMPCNGYRVMARIIDQSIRSRNGRKI